MLKSLVACFIIYLMCTIELTLRRLDLDDGPGYVVYMLGVAARRELYFDDDERLDGAV